MKNVVPLIVEFLFLLQMLHKVLQKVKFDIVLQAKIHSQYTLEYRIKSSGNTRYIQNTTLQLFIAAIVVGQLCSPVVERVDTDVKEHQGWKVNGVDSNISITLPTNFGQQLPNLLLNAWKLSNFTCRSLTWFKHILIQMLFMLNVIYFYVLKRI